MIRNAFVLAAALSASQLPAAAHANDACLVGRWEPQGNAMADWLKKHNPQIAVHASPQQAWLVFRADGTYQAESHGQASVRNGAATGSLQGRLAGSGRWSATGGQLVMTQTRDQNQAQLQVKGGGGAVASARLPQGRLGGPQTWGYSCKGNRLEARIPLPGGKDVVTQAYLRK